VWTSEESKYRTRGRSLQRIWFCEIVCPLFFSSTHHFLSAFPQDAITAVEKFQGKDLAGRRLILEIAVFSGQSTKQEKDLPVPTKPPKEIVAAPAPAPAPASRPEKKTKTTETSSSATTPSPSGSLQVLVSGVPSHVNKKMFKEIVQNVYRCKKLVVELVKEVLPSPPLPPPPLTDLT
jgi:hypothetical protein